MNLTTQFLYNIGNMALYTPELVDIAVWIIVSLVLVVLMRYIFLFHIGLFTIWRESRLISAKKHVLSDLILMKDIQSEMEKELEQASLRATFQG